MKTRLRLVLVGTVIVITVAAGAGTWLLAASSVRSETISEVLTSVKSFGASNSGEITVGRPNSTPRALATEVRLVQRLIRLSSHLTSATFLNPARPAGLFDRYVPSAVLNSVAASAELGPPSARAGSTGSTAWAAEAIAFHLQGKNRRGRPVNMVHRFVLVVTRAIGSPSISGELVLAGAMLLFALVVSLALGQRITRPLRRAVAATQRIAAGELDARVQTQPGDFPELRALAAAIDAMAASLNHLRQAERQFLLSVSHELRTPLTSIRGYSEAILDGTAADPAQAAAVIGNESRRLERLVGDLLDLAKLDARTFSFNFRTVDVGEVLDEVAEELRPLVDSAKLALQVQADDRPLMARVDPDRLDQVLANLVENATRYARTTVWLRCCADGPDAQLVVEDDGPGIGPDEIGRIFERHYRADRHARPGRPHGSGLGLAIASELAAAMGATVTAASPVDDHGGTRMIVRVPVITGSRVA
jgi:signal transduction histidine kinase